jgi:hypothetical protein
MKQFIKSVALVAAGLVWLGFALIIGILLFQGRAEGGGLPILNLFGFDFLSLNIGLGFVHFVGFFAAAFLCFLVGIWLCTLGLSPEPAVQKAAAGINEKRLSLISRIFSKRMSQAQVSGLTCVCCGASVKEQVRLCPDCGWTQPGAKD